MRAKTRNRSVVFRYTAAGFLSLIIGLRFHVVGDEIGTAIYTFVTVAALVMASAHLAGKE
jgi:hypothetical protein